MTIDGEAEPRRGDVFWLADAATGRGSADADRAHPHVVVSDDVFNRSRVSTVVVCAISTNAKLANEPGNVRLVAGEAGLPKPSVIVVSRIESVPKNALGERIGRLDPSRVDAALAGLRFLQASTRG